MARLFGKRTAQTPVPTAPKTPAKPSGTSRPRKAPTTVPAGEYYGDLVRAALRKPLRRG